MRASKDGIGRSIDHGGLRNLPQQRPSSTPSMSLSASRRTIRGFTGASLMVLSSSSSSEKPPQLRGPQPPAGDDRGAEDDAVIVEEMLSSSETTPVKPHHPAATGKAGRVAQDVPATEAAALPKNELTETTACPPPAVARTPQRGDGSDEVSNALVSSAIAQPALPVRPSSCSSRPRHVNLGKKELLGKGSFGMVYRAMDLDTNRIIAVKEVVMAPGTVGPSLLGPLRREIALMQQLDHPNIVKCLGEHWDGVQHLRIFMEYIAGGTISSILRSFGAFTELQASRFTRQVLNGLEYLHDRRIAHRDLKGDNLLVDVDGTVKLADFGTAKELATRTKSMAGTAFFMAPEVIRGVGHGIEADIWSLGCCVVEMLLGKPPFSSFSNQYAIMMHVADLKDEGFPLPPNISAACTDFLRRCFRVDPRERPTVAELLRHPWIVEPPENAELCSINILHPDPETTRREPAPSKLIQPTATFTGDSYNPIQSFDPDEASGQR